MDLGHLQSQCRYSIEDDNNDKLLLAHISKMSNIAKSETLAIDKKVLSIKATISKKKSDIRVKKVWVLQ